MKWVRKSINELATESKKRHEKVRFIYYLIQLASLYFIADDFVKHGGVISILKTNPERITLLLLPLLFYFFYRNYVTTGSIDRTQDRMCLFCKKGMWSGDSGWGFKNYGKKKPKWYQFKACRQPDKCDLVYMHQVKLIANENDEK